MSAVYPGLIPAQSVQPARSPNYTELTIHCWMWLFSCTVFVLSYYVLREQEKYVWSLDKCTISIAELWLGTIFKIQITWQAWAQHTKGEEQYRENDGHKQYIVEAPEIQGLQHVHNLVDAMGSNAPPILFLCSFLSFLLSNLTPYSRPTCWQSSLLPICNRAAQNGS